MTQSNYIISKVPAITTTFIHILTYEVWSNTARKFLQIKTLIAIPVFAVFEKHPKQKKTQENKNILGLGLKQIQQIQQIQELHIHELSRRSLWLQLSPFVKLVAPVLGEIYKAINTKWVLPGSSVFHPPEGTRGGEARVLFFAKECFGYSQDR